MLRVALIPRGVINHGGDKPWCIQSERYPIRGGLAEKQRLAQALLCIWRYSRTICIIFGVWDCCLLNQVYIHSFRSTTEAIEMFRGVGVFDHLECTYNGAFEQLFVLGRGNFPKIFQIFKCPGGCPGGMFKLRFDWYIQWMNKFSIQLTTNTTGDILRFSRNLTRLRRVLENIKD